MRFKERKNKYIGLPCNLILTKDGINFISGSSLKIQRVTNHMGFNCDGVISKSYNGETLQKMVMNSYLEEVLVKLPVLLDTRFEIISTNSLIIYAILYKKLSPAVWEMFSQSNVVKNYNRKNPKNSIVNFNQLNRKVLKEFMQNEKHIFDIIKEEVFLEVKALVEAADLSDEDKTLQVKCLDKFIAWIDERIWYLYSIVYRTDLKENMLHDFAKIITGYLQRTQIATHLSNLLMELVQNAERAHLIRLVVRNNLSGPGEAEDFLRNRKNRDKVTKIALNNKEELMLSWSMNSEKSSFGTKYRIHISLSNHGIIDEMTQQSLKRKMHTNVDGLSIAEFYGSPNADNGGQLGAGLGLLYHSYLEDYCRNLGVMYSCNIYPEPKKELTTVSLDIGL